MNTTNKNAIKFRPSNRLTNSLKEEFNITFRKVSFINSLKKIKLFCEFEIEQNCELSYHHLSGNVKIGAFTIISDKSYIGGNTIIGKYCSIADHVTIGSGEHHLNELSTSAYFYSQGYLGEKNNLVNVKRPISKTIYIGNDVWIGANVMISQGLTIGDGSVIGAGSIITKDVSPYVVVVGDKHRIIKYRDTPEAFGAPKDWWNYKQLKNNHNKEILISKVLDRASLQKLYNKFKWGFFF